MPSNVKKRKTFDSQIAAKRPKIDSGDGTGNFIDLLDAETITVATSSQGSFIRDIRPFDGSYNIGIGAESNDDENGLDIVSPGNTIIH
ncbi:hypothetical protein MMC32_008255 [Xylographa parallela]|nr:hypothetical protein [Xylographa parallela]